MTPPPPSSPKKKKAASAAASTPPPKKKKSSSRTSSSSTSAAVAVAAAMPTAVTVASAAAAPAVTPDSKKPAATAAAPTNKRTSSPPVDPDIMLHGANATDYTVVPVDSKNTFYDAVLNQCNIAGNNNKYYRIQMVQQQNDTGGGAYFVWHKWGRVGEAARKSTSKWFGPFATLEKALPHFTKKYKDKTGNVFGAPNFVAKNKKYVPVEIDNDVQVDEDDLKAAPSASAAAAAARNKVEYLPSTLDAKTQELVQVLFSDDMRNEVLQSFHLDLKKLPLGVPSQSQIQRGVDILGQIEEKLNGTTEHQESYEDLSSRFYTTIPHSFGRNRPPVIGTAAALQSRYDMCNILLDMYSTHETMRKIDNAQKDKQQTTTQVPSPVDEHYRSLQADLSLVSSKSDDYTKIQTYFDKTKGRHSSSVKLLNVWCVDRQGEGQRFAKFDELDNRRLLWHGTNIAVVAPILTSGLRIMPHSGGRVGAGIYLACMQEKSAQYTSGYGAKFACMFLCEAPLGKAHLIHQDGSHASSLRAAPTGFDSVQAVGEVRPNSWESIDLDGKAVQVPQEQPTIQNNDVQTSFYHDEFLVYNEAQVRIRYVVTVKL